MNTKVQFISLVTVLVTAACGSAATNNSVSTVKGQDHQPDERAVILYVNEPHETIHPVIVSRIRNQIDSLVSSGLVGFVQNRDITIHGGEKTCLELADGVPSIRIDEISSVFTSTPADPWGTSYRTEIIETCPRPDGDRYSNVTSEIDL